MRSHDKFFILIFTAAITLTGGLMYENIRLLKISQMAAPPVNIKEVKRKIEEAQLVPLEAKFWVVVD